MGKETHDITCFDEKKKNGTCKTVKMIAQVEGQRFELDMS